MTFSRRNCFFLQTRKNRLELLGLVAHGTPTLTYRTAVHEGEESVARGVRTSYLLRVQPAEQIAATYSLGSEQ
jgi:hypothetical protein